MTLSFDFVIVNVGTTLFDSMSILMDSETLTESWVLLFTIFEVCLLLHGKYLDDEIVEAIGATS